MLVASSAALNQQRYRFSTALLLVVVFLPRALAIPAGRIVPLAFNGDVQADVPAGDDFVAVAAGNGHNLALKSDGSLVAWGTNYAGETSDTPLGNNFTAIATGGTHSLALKSDGTLAAWGLNTSGSATVPPGNNFVAIDGGQQHSVALKSDGSLAAFGPNSSGEINVPLGNDYTAISAGEFHSLALKSNGSIVASATVQANPDGGGCPRVRGS